MRVHPSDSLSLQPGKSPLHRSSPAGSSRAGFLFASPFARYQNARSRLASSPQNHIPSDNGEPTYFQKSFLAAIGDVEQTWPKNDEANPVTWLTSVSLARYPLRTADATESNPETGWDDGVFRDHDDAVADKVVVCIQVRRFAFGCDYDAISDADVLIDDGAVDHAIASDAHTRLR